MDASSSSLCPRSASWYAEGSLCLSRFVIPRAVASACVAALLERVVRAAGLRGPQASAGRRLGAEARPTSRSTSPSTPAAASRSPTSRPQDFHIYEDGQPVSVLESKQTILQPEVAAIHYTLLLVDMSGSVVDSGDMPALDPGGVVVRRPGRPVPEGRGLHLRRQPAHHPGGRLRRQRARRASHALATPPAARPVDQPQRRA